MNNKIKDRAETPEQKADILKRLLECWLKSPSLRLGQMLDAITYLDDQKLFLIEDEAIIVILEEWSDKKK